MTNFFIFLQKSKKEATNFDTEFTKEDPVLTPINQEIVKTIDQEEFAGFSYHNSAFGKLLVQPGPVRKNSSRQNERTTVGKIILFYPKTIDIYPAPYLTGPEQANA